MYIIIITHADRRSALVGFSSQSICLFVFPQHNSKTNDPKVFKLGIGNPLGIPRSGTVLGFKGQGHRVNKCAEHNSKTKIVNAVVCLCASV